MKLSDVRHCNDGRLAFKRRTSASLVVSVIKTYYSKKHLDDIFRPDLKASDAYYTTAEAAEKYGMTKCNICVIVKTNNLTKVKVGARNLKLDK